jgi:tRNA (adenine22-N1)-methyltransferase
MKNIEVHISGRMKMVIDCVSPCDTVYDIGTDHGYIPIYLVLKGMCKTAVATDVKMMPVQKAIRNAALFGVSESMKIFQAGGISHVKDGACIIISGMGAYVIIDMLKKDMDIAKKSSVLIIQCQHMTELLRTFLWDNGFEIYLEKLCEDDNKIYNVICTSYTGKNVAYSKKDVIASKYLVENRDPLLGSYIKPYLKKLNDRIEGLLSIHKSCRDLEDLKKELEDLNEKDENI